MLKLSFHVAGLLLAIVSVATPVPVLSQAFQPTQKLATTNPQPIRLEIQRSKRQVVVYHGKTRIKTYPIAVGKPGWETPLGTFKVQQMMRNPKWISPKTGESIPAGDPENPLGRYWIGFWTDGNNWIGFHGTPNPESVGSAASHGCVRMYNEDVEELFAKVTLGTEVTVVK
jgi:lipoprotein-anchoring transpeptidase ErfK/SrfK